MSSETEPTLPLVLVGPSAVGKGTLTQMLFTKYPTVFGKKVSTTTRVPRQGEVHGKDYFFVTMEEFVRDEKEGLFVETAEIHGKKYGTSFEAIRQASSGDRIPLLELDVQGVCTVKRLGADVVEKVLGDDSIAEDDCTHLQPPVMDTLSIWINPPSPQSLLDRLQGRGTETTEQIEKRMTTAKFELAFFKKYYKLFNKVIVNDNIDLSFAELEQFLFNHYPRHFVSADKMTVHETTISVESTNSATSAAINKEKAAI